MFGFLKKIRKQSISYEQLKILQMVTQQVVLSVESSVKVPGAEKKALALEIVGKILQEMRLIAPESLVDAMLESAVSVLRALEKAQEEASRPKFSLDISGRPKSGN